MKSFTGKSRLAATLAVCLVGWMSQAGHAQAVTIGVVDEDKLAQNYSKYKNAVSEIEKRAQDLDRQLAARTLLTGDDAKKFDELIAKTGRNQADNDQLEKLVKAGTDQQAKYIGLVGKATRTDVENGEMKTLEKRAEENKPAVERISNELYQKMKQEQEGTDRSHTELANKVIRQVAEDKKLSLVVRKLAVIWSADAMDITDEVLKRLNG